MSVDEAAAAARWPELTARAGQHGVASFLASPLLVEGSGRGSIDLYSMFGSSFDGAEADLLAVLASYVSRGLADFAALPSVQVQVQVQVEHMLLAMVGRAPIEQAKGILMAVQQITADAAFELLRIQSQDTKTKLRDVAAVFVAAQTRQPLGPDAETPAVADGSADFPVRLRHLAHRERSVDLGVDVHDEGAGRRRFAGAPGDERGGSTQLRRAARGRAGPRWVRDAPSSSPGRG